MTERRPGETTQSAAMLPFFACVSAPWDDWGAGDSYSWEGWATDADMAFEEARKACRQNFINVHRAGPEVYGFESDYMDADQWCCHVCEVDFRTVAIHLAEWDKLNGPVDHPVWRRLHAMIAGSDVGAFPITFLPGHVV